MTFAPRFWAVAVGCLALLAGGPLQAGTAADEPAPDPPVPQPAEAPPEKDRKPLIEVGGVGAWALLPDYPGSDESHTRPLGLPFVIYRGDILRADANGVRGRFYRGDRVDLDLSLGGSLPTSGDNEARRGMPDLDLAGEIGPSLRINLAKVPTSWRVDLELGTRAVFTTDYASVTSRGWVFAPELSVRELGLAVPGSRLRLGIGPIFATGRYMDYFYEVRPRFERPGRPAYEADPGYLGSRLQGSYTVPITSWLSLFGGGRIDVLTGATNEDSPLFRRDLNVAAILGVSFSLYQSAATVPARDDLFD